MMDQMQLLHEKSRVVKIRHTQYKAWVTLALTFKIKKI